MKRVRAILLILPLTVVTAGAQSLADLARQQREARDQGRRSQRTITTEAATARRPGTLSIAGAVAPSEPEESTAQAGPPAGTPEDAAPVRPGIPIPAPDDPEETWRAAFAEARREITRAQNSMLLGQAEILDLNNQLLNRTDIYNREYQLAPMITAKEQEIEGAQRQLNDATQALDQLQSELRRAGLPAGWAR